MRYIFIVISIIQAILLYNYDQFYEKNYQLVKKYAPLEEALSKVKSQAYTENHNCLEFSKDLQKELEKIGIQSSILIGEDEKTINDPNTQHAFISLWIEPQTGEFTKNYYYGNSYTNE